jgi:hypothetical protein
MTNTQIGLLTLQVILSLTVLVFLVIRLLKVRQEKYSYKLYALRDELIYLVAAGELREDSFMFKVFYKVINQSISDIEDLTRWSFVKASIKAKTTLQQQSIQKLLQEIGEASPAVHEVVDNFFDTMVAIFKANSPFTALCVDIGRWAKDSHKVVFSLINFGVNLGNRLIPVERYETYRFFEKYAEQHDHQPA